MDYHIATDLKDDIPHCHGLYVDKAVGDDSRANYLLIVNYIMSIHQLESHHIIGSIHSYEGKGHQWMPFLGPFN